MENKTDITAKYNHAAELIKNAILHGQYEAAKGINRVHLLTNFAIGKYVSLNTRKGIWGSGALRTISERLRKIMPGLRGYGETQLKEMRLFYEAWSFIDTNSSVATDELKHLNSSVATDELQGVDSVENILNLIKIETPINFPMDDYLRTPFTHHTTIVRKCCSNEERFYYMRRCVEEHMSVQRLEKIISDKEFNKGDTLPNNFIERIGNDNLARKAVLQFKDSYFLDFINTEELGERDIEDIDERVIENAIVHNIKNFIMTFGHDFTFIGNQYRIDAFGESHYIDLLFFNRELACMVAVELKTGRLKSSYMGQLRDYLALLDDFVKKPHENPSIGIVLCKDVDRTRAQYLIRQYDKPMGVATYKTHQEMPEKLRKALPDIEDLKKLL